MRPTDGLKLVTCFSSSVGKAGFGPSGSMPSQDGAPGCHPRIPFEDGIPGWHPRMPSLVSDRKIP